MCQQVPVGLKRQRRADSAFYGWDVIEELERRQITYAITADRSESLKTAIAALPAPAWRRFGPDSEVAQVAYAPGRHVARRYVVKRVALTDQQGQAYDRYHAVVTNERQQSPNRMMRWALGRGQLENLIKAHQTGFGWAKLPTQQFLANGVWLRLGQLAFKLVVWFKRLILPAQYHQAPIKTIRPQGLKVAGKIGHSGRRWDLVLSDSYWYQEVWRSAVQQLAKLKTCGLIRGVGLPACATSD